MREDLPAAVSTDVIDDSCRRLKTGIKGDNGPPKVNKSIDFVDKSTYLLSQF